ncbi:MAG: sugar transferase [Anaerolineales bacterium]|nr:sugar transferase [Anaerolineales bacterium]
MPLMRLVDIAGSAAGLVVLSPMLLLLAVLVKLDAPGPIFCTQERMEPDGRRWLKLKFCVRRNWLGVMMHRFSVDELPVLISVLLGEVSLVELRLK